MSRPESWWERSGTRHCATSKSMASRRYRTGPTIARALFHSAVRSSRFRPPPAESAGFARNETDGAYYCAASLTTSGPSSVPAACRIRICATVGVASRRLLLRHGNTVRAMCDAANPRLALAWRCRSECRQPCVEGRFSGTSAAEAFEVLCGGLKFSKASS